jgi:hypothetical protein
VTSELPLIGDMVFTSSVLILLSDYPPP